MLSNFNKTFRVTEMENSGEKIEFLKDVPSDVFNIMKGYGGMTFNGGLYRIHTYTSSVHWSIQVADYFSKYKNKILPFGFDWMGRQFCVHVNDHNMVIMLDPATGEDFEMRQDILSFHEEDLAMDVDNMLAYELFKNILSHYKISDIRFSECLGYRIPLFLGGIDNIDNYEKSDLEVYWHIHSQIFNKIRIIPSGTPINSIKIE